MEDIKSTIGPNHLTVIPESCALPNDEQERRAREAYLIEFVQAHYPYEDPDTGKREPLALEVNSAMQELVSMHRDTLMKKASRKLPYKEVEDAVQDTLERIWKYLPKFQNEGRGLEPILTTILNNRVKDYYKSPKSGVVFREYDFELEQDARKQINDPLTDMENPANEIASNDIVERIIVIAQLALTAKQFGMVWASVQGKRAEFIQDNGLSEGAGKLLISRARKTLARHLEAAGIKPPDKFGVYRSL